mmetsp:Transcript_127677/g.408693  ORF Transcript_127677/g.408693 Transcript_127677/m.408693 type:complete len:238 (+) Transcript_127677:213-926(+)
MQGRQPNCQSPECSEQQGPLANPWTVDQVAAARSLAAGAEAQRFNSCSEQPATIPRCRQGSLMHQTSWGATSGPCRTLPGTPRRWPRGYRPTGQTPAGSSVGCRGCEAAPATPTGPPASPARPRTPSSPHSSAGSRQASAPPALPPAPPPFLTAAPAEAAPAPQRAAPPRPQHRLRTASPQLPPHRQGRLPGEPPMGGPRNPRGPSRPPPRPALGSPAPCRPAAAAPQPPHRPRPPA